MHYGRATCLQRSGAGGSNTGKASQLIAAGGREGVKRGARAFEALACETEVSLMIKRGISLNGKQRSGLSWRGALTGILGSRASPGFCTITRPPACWTAMSPFVPSLPPPVTMISFTREPNMLVADRM